MKRKIGDKEIEQYREHLVKKERSPATTEKYIRDITRFREFNGRKEVVPERVILWKAYLLEAEYKDSSINSMLAALNSFFEFMGWHECRVKQLRVQKETYRKPEKELCREEYMKLVAAAKEEGDERLSLIMQTICSTGIRVSELPFITVEAVMEGYARIYLKGKIRTVFLPDYLISVLKRYVDKQDIREGAVFVTRANLPVSRTNIWRGMKELCEKTGIDPGKVFPHNLRHLFAKTHYTKYHDVVRLSDILGHSSVETTRIYMMESGKTHIWQINQLDLLYEKEILTT